MPQMQRNLRRRLVMERSQPRGGRRTSHLGSMPSLNRWKSVPAMRREGVTMLLYKLQRISGKVCCVGGSS